MVGQTSAGGAGSTLALTSASLAITEVTVGVAQLVDDPAVGQEHHPVGVRRGDRVVG